MFESMFPLFSVLARLVKLIALLAYRIQRDIMSQFTGLFVLTRLGTTIDPGHTVGPDVSRHPTALHGIKNALRKTCGAAFGK